MQRKLFLNKYFLPVILFLSMACGKEPEKKTIFTKILSKKKEHRLSEKEVTEKVKRLDAYFENLQSKKGFNGVVLAANGTQIIFEKAFGYEDYRTKKPLSVQAVFQLASVSKQFTAAAIMLLKQRGALSFEDSIQKFFIGFPYQGITIRHLLTHHSGLSNYTYFCDKVSDRKKIIDNQTVLHLMTEQKPAPYFLPGVRYDYSNTGYILLAAVVEKVSNMKFEDFMRKNIFLPCKMRDTYVYNHGTPVTIPDLVEGYNYGRRKVARTYLDGVVGDKGVYSNVRDLYKWNRILYTDSLFKPEIIEEAYQPAFPEKKNRDNYGFGWRIKNKKDKIVWHGGWWEGYKSMFLRNLKDETVIIVLTNSLAGHLKSEELLDVYYGE
jgi:CubicO group peptidase (beta-lactamase class C family)